MSNIQKTSHAWRKKPEGVLVGPLVQVGSTLADYSPAVVHRPDKEAQR